LYNAPKRQKEFVDEIFVEDFIKNNKILKDYSKTIHMGDSIEVNFRLSISIIDTLFIYKTNKLNALERMINDKKEELETLNNCLSHIDATLGKYFLNNSKNHNILSPLRDKSDSYNNIDIIKNNNSNYINNQNANEDFHNKYLSNDFHYTEKVENYFLKILGRDLFKWDYILFFSNKILLLLSIFSWIYKIDYSTVI